MLPHLRQQARRAIHKFREKVFIAHGVARAAAVLFRSREGEGSPVAEVHVNLSAHERIALRIEHRVELRC